MIPTTLGEMIAGQKLLTVAPGDSVRAACILMSSGNVGALPVVDEDGALVGMISERDVIKRSVIVYRPSEETPVSLIMTRDPRWLPPDAPPRAAADAMREGGFRHLPVCGEGGLMGIVSVRDFDVAGNPVPSRDARAAVNAVNGRPGRPPSALRSA